MNILVKQLGRFSPLSLRPNAAKVVLRFHGRIPNRRRRHFHPREGVCFECISPTTDQLANQLERT